MSARRLMKINGLGVNGDFPKIIFLKFQDVTSSSQFGFLVSSIIVCCLYTTANRLVKYSGEDPKAPTPHT